MLAQNYPHLRLNLQVHPQVHPQTHSQALLQGRQSSHVHPPSAPCNNCSPKTTTLVSQVGAEERKRLLDSNTWPNDNIIDHWIKVMARKNPNPIYGFVGVFFYEDIGWQNQGSIMVRS